VGLGLHAFNKHPMCLHTPCMQEMEAKARWDARGAAGRAPGAPHARAGPLARSRTALTRALGRARPPRRNMFAAAGRAGGSAEFEAQHHLVARRPEGLEMVGVGGDQAWADQGGGPEGGGPQGRQGAQPPRDSWGATTGRPVSRTHTGFAFSSPSFEEFFAEEARHPRSVLVDHCLGGDDCSRSARLFAVMLGAAAWCLWACWPWLCCDVEWHCMCDSGLL
jgi:hypothetical protein